MSVLFILVPLLFFFGFIISMAIGNGLYMTMRLDLDPNAGARPFSKSHISFRKYRQQFPESRKPKQVIAAFITAFGFLILIILYASLAPGLAKILGLS